MILIIFRSASIRSLAGSGEGPESPKQVEVGRQITTLEKAFTSKMSQGKLC